MENGKAYLAELVGTFSLVFFGSMSVTVFAGILGPLNGGGLVGIALAHGIVLMVAVYAYGKVSGAHINPAITIAHIVAKKIEAGKGIVYIVMQLIGGAIAGVLQWFVLPEVGKATWYGLPQLGDAVGKVAMSGMVTELALTMFLALSVYAVVSGKVPEDAAGLAIGGTLLLALLIGGPLTGAALNPARHFGPAIASLLQGNNIFVHAEMWIVYWMGPIVGALIGTFVYKLGMAD